MTQIHSGITAPVPTRESDDKGASPAASSQSADQSGSASTIPPPALSDRVTLSTALPSDHRATPIPPVTAHRHKAASAWQVLELQKNEGNIYSFLQKDTSAYIQPAVDGRFLYTILAGDPDRIFVGAPKGSHSANEATFGIQGHTSITYSRDVLYAGELLFRNGKLAQWNNDSGHYRPAAELRHTNLRPALQRILPEHLFTRSRIRDDAISPPSDPRPHGASRTAAATPPVILNPEGSDSKREVRRNAVPAPAGDVGQKARHGTTPSKRNIFTYLLRRDADDRSAPPAVPARQIKGVSAMTQIQSGTTLTTTTPVANEHIPPATPSQSGAVSGLAAAAPQPVPADRVTLSSGSQSGSRAAPIVPVTTHLHDPATPWQVLELQKNAGNNYSFLQKSDTAYVQPRVDGKFNYVILADDPERIYIGAPPGLSSSNDAAFSLQGHTSITAGKDVLYAGEMLFSNGQLVQWNNESGHYKPPAELRHTNLGPALQRLLPEHLFSATWIPCHAEPDLLQSAPHRRAPAATEIRAFAQLGEDAGARIRPFGAHTLSSHQSENGLLLAHALATRIKPPHDYLPTRGYTPSASALTGLRQSMASDRFTAHLNTLGAPDSSAIPNLDDALKQWDYRQRIDSIGTQIDSLPFSAQRLRDLPAWLAVQTSTTHLLLDMPQGSASLWVDHSGATPTFGLVDPALGIIEGIPDHTTLDTILSQHFNDAYAANQTTTAYTITGDAADRLAGTYPTPDLLGGKHYSARDLLAVQDRRDGLLRLGSQEIARIRLHDMGAMLDNRAIDAASLQRATLTGDLMNRLQFDGATLQHQFKTDGNADRLTGLLYDIGTSRTTPATTPVIINPEGTAGKWGVQMNAVLALAGEVGQKARSDATQPKRNIFTYLLPGGGAVSHTGVGLQAFGVYNGIRGIKDAVARGDTTDIAVNSAGLVAEAASLGVEKGVVALGSYLQKGNVASFNAFANTSIGSKLGGAKALGTNVGRTAGAFGTVITTPFDIYSAYTSLSQAGNSKGKVAQDHYVNGGLAVAGAASSLALAGAAFAGVAAAGPIGIAVGAALALGGGIYSSARYVEDLDAHANLSGWEKFVTGIASFVGSGASQDIEDRVAISKAQGDYDNGKRQLLHAFLKQSRPYGEAIFGNAVITAQTPLTHRGAPNQHGLRKKNVTQRPALATDNGADHINARRGTAQVKNRVTAPATNGDAVYWATGDGHDRLTGVGWRSNTFDLGHGKKQVQGGWQNDRIRLGTGITNGSYFDGGDGNDTLDLSAAASGAGAGAKRSFVVKLPETKATEAISADLYWQDNVLRTSGAPQVRPVETASGHVATRGQRATLNSIENVITAKNARTKVTGNDKDNLFVLNGRNDSARGGGGNDIYVVNGGGTVRIAAGDGNNRYQIGRTANIVEITTAPQSPGTELNLAWNLDEITVQARDGNVEILLGRKRQKTIRLQDVAQTAGGQWAGSQQTMRVVDGKPEVLLTRTHQKKIRLQDAFHQNTGGQWQARQPDGALKILTRDGYLLTPVLSSRTSAPDGLLQVMASISPHRLPAPAATAT
ncbi:hypothetical protein [Herbaspirillum autotrophicum]|uniref:hypothetical protein n=1 Tax=Herbaspirillum autotrophicum TaxID=180195 RepID=UPI00067B8E12|nr:hypothetical protein [Herbaspirillum autotrophicum]